MAVGLFLLAMALTAPSHGQESSNLALRAKAFASEFQPGFPAELANDGSAATRWSGIPGHNAGVWFELRWDKPVSVAQVIVRQYGRFTFEWDLQTWDESGQTWMDAGHYGKPGVRLPGTVFCEVKPSRQTSRVRIANITNGPSFKEVEVYSSPQVQPLTMTLASDLRGNFVGMACDAPGDVPVSGKTVTLEGRANGQPWTATAKSDDHGLFFAPMPLGLKGAVVARADGIPPLRSKAEDFQYGLTPLDLLQKPTVFDQGWRFAPDPPKGFEKPGLNDATWSKIKVPAHWEMEGFHTKTGFAGYRLHFRPPTGKGRVILRFDGVYSGAEVWVNGVYVAGHQGGFTPFEADVTDVVRPMENVLAVRVQEKTEVSELLDKMSIYADFSLGGIMRKVTMFRVPDFHVCAYEQATTFDAERTIATVKGSLSLLNTTRKPRGLPRVAISLIDASGTTVSFQAVQIPVGPLSRAVSNFALQVKSPHPWTAESPYLYTLRFQVTTLGKSVQTLNRRIGLRQTEVAGTAINIDKSPVKFRGTCHHDSDPLMGRAVTPELTRKDLLMIKEANLNSVRTSHYPPVPELLDQADELGLYVEDEADFCWVGSADDLRLTPQILQLTAELVARDRNHPSVFMWSLCNESSFGYAFERSHEWVRGVDPSRPTGAATSAWLEIATLHNPIATKRIHDNEGIDKPLLFDESFAPYQGIFNDVAELWVDPGMRDYYGQPFPDIYRAMMESKTTQGSMIWAWSDDLFCVPNRGFEYGRGATLSHFVENSYALPKRGIVGDAPWGVVDGWRRPKPELWIVKKLHSPVKIAEQAITLGKPFRLTVRNEYDFTNLGELVVRASVGGVVKVLPIDVPPRQTGQIVVPAFDPSAKSLRLTFTDKQGRLVDAYEFPSGPHLAAAPRTGRPLALENESTLAGETTHVVGDNFRLSFDRSSGQIRRSVVFGWPLLLELPAIHVLPTATPTAQFPSRNDWRLDAMDVSIKDGTAVATINGHYPNLAGSYEVSVSSAGQMTIHARFKYSGPDVLAREVGMQFSVPRTCDTLSWNRNAEWSAYPADHIGRPIGTAKAFYPHADTVPPTWPWSQDNTPLGSNDFRSTKRRIKSASIGYPGGPSIAIDSDGEHALRAMLEPDRATVAVNDWYGGTNVGWGEWITNYGQGRLIKSGETLESSLILRFVKAP